jgi:zinc-binding alcohol dehydrogenase family protein
MRKKLQRLHGISPVFIRLGTEVKLYGNCQRFATGKVVEGTYAEETPMTQIHAVVWDAGAGKFREIEDTIETPAGYDLLVEVTAVSVNPVDLKVRAMTAPGDAPRQLGYDACGRVIAAGLDAAGFAAGDRVYYAGAIVRPGSNASHHLVDSRIAALAPKSLDDADAAAIPLTALTAWEALFERLRIEPLTRQPAAVSLLVINGAGGVGSFALQLAKLSGLAPTATASRAESAQWCRELGAAATVSHADLKSMEGSSFDRIFCCYDTDPYFDTMTRLVAPQGIICSIVGGREPKDLMPLFQKSASFSWEYMFTRSTFRTADMERQGQILARVAQLIDSGELRTTRNRTLAGLSAATVSQAHEIMAAGHQIGKLVIAY